MFEEEFEFFIKETYPKDYESMKAKFLDHGITEQWPEQWEAFKYLKSQFNELIEENTRLDRESKTKSAEVKELSRCIDQAVSVIDSHAKTPLCPDSTTLKAVRASLTRCGR